MSATHAHNAGKPLSDPTLSRRVKLLRFPLIVLVLYIHSYIAPVTLGRTTLAVQPATWLLALQAAWSNGFARTAVPLFFLMSGYLYFLGFDGSFANYRTKTTRRVGTLLVPFLFWNTLVMIVFAVGQVLPQTAGYFNAGNGRVIDATPFGIIDMLFGITHYPMAYQFWFIRDLMVIALLAPVIYWAIRLAGPLLPGLLLIVWFFGLPFAAVPSIEATTFFVIGAWLAQRGSSLFPPANWVRWLAPLYCVALASDVTTRMLGHDNRLYCTVVLIGIALVLALTGLIREGGALSRRLVTMSAASFFVFAAHEPLMTMLRKLIYRGLPPTQVTIFTAYGLLPLTLAIVLVALYFASMRIAPRFIGIISGGR